MSVPALRCSPMPHDVTLVLCGPDGQPLGVLPPFAVSDQWWPEVSEVVQVARDRYGLDVAVLRLLHGARGPGIGDATYLAQTDQSAVDASSERHGGHPNSVAKCRWARAALPPGDQGRLGRMRDADRYELVASRRPGLGTNVSPPMRHRGWLASARRLGTL